MSNHSRTFELAQINTHITAPLVSSGPFVTAICMTIINELSFVPRAAWRPLAARQHHSSRAMIESPADRCVRRTPVSHELNNSRRHWYLCTR